MLHQRRSRRTAVSKDGSRSLKSKVRTENEWKKTVAALQLRGGIFCGQSRRRDAGVSLPDMFEFSFSWPGESFPLWDVDSCGVAQFNLSEVTW